MIESNDIKALTWYVWRSGALDSISKKFAKEAAASLEQFTHCNETLSKESLSRFFELNEPRPGEFLIQFWTDDSSDDVILASTSQRIWLFDLDQNCLIEFELSRLISVAWKVKWTHALVLIETADGEVKTIRAKMAPDAKAVNYAIKNCRKQPWAISLDEQSKASIDDELTEPDPEPIGIGVSSTLDSLVGCLAHDEEWLCLGLATWTTVGTEVKTGFYTWINRAFFGVLGDALTPEHRKCGIVAISRSGRLYLASLGDFVDSDQLEILVSETTIDPASIAIVSISDISVSWEKDRLVANIDNRSLQLGFPNCFVPDNERLGRQIERAVSSAWKYS